MLTLLKTTFIINIDHIVMTSLYNKFYKMTATFDRSLMDGQWFNEKSIFIEVEISSNSICGEEPWVNEETNPLQVR